MKMWIDWTTLLKRATPGTALDFFTYGELLYWFVFVVLINPFRWKWALFVLFGIGARLPISIVEKEDAIRAKHGAGPVSGSKAVNGEGYGITA